MIPAAFEYHAPSTIDEATALLAKLGEDAKILSGGQSLIPLMKLRLASPTHLVDINGIPGLSGIREDDGFLRIGALTRESELEESELVRTRYPLLHDTSKVIADPLVRNLATVGGNLAHGDPANDHPATMLALGAEIVAAGPKGERRIPVASFFTGPFATALGADEILTEIRVPSPSPRSGGAYLKLERKVGDFATAAVAGQPDLDTQGTCEQAGIGLTNVRAMPVKTPADGQVLHGVGRPGPQQAAHDGGGLGAERQAPSAPGRLHGGARVAVRVLHARHADDQLRVPQEASGADGGPDPPRHLRQPLPVHRVREHRQGHPVRGGQARSRRRTMTPKTSLEVGGMGHSIKRKEDPRFIRGKGTYVDDVQLPGMLYLDIARSPFAHAKITRIGTSKALAIPGVLAVITGQDLAKYNLHWMPTLMSDTQMVLPVDKVMFQSQEVAAVLATDRYIAADGVEAVEVEYDPLPVVVDPKKALEPGAPILRTDKKDKKDNHIFHWEVGDRAATHRAFAAAAVTVKQDIYIPRIHVASIETCGCIAHFDKVNEKLTVWMTTQAPHAIRTVVALVAGHVGLSEERIRIIAPDIGGGFGGEGAGFPGFFHPITSPVVT